MTPTMRVQVESNFKLKSCKVVSCRTVAITLRESRGSNDTQNFAGVMFPGTVLLGVGEPYLHLISQGFVAESGMRRSLQVELDTVPLDVAFL